MNDVNWTVTESDGNVTRQGKKMAYKAPFEITDKTPKPQLPVIEGWNEMRQCLIENELMEPQ